MAAARSGIVSGDTLGVAFGKLAKYCTDIEDHAFNALVNNGLANIAGVSALDAVQANPDVADTLAYKIAQNLAAITSLNSKTPKMIFKAYRSIEISSSSIPNYKTLDTFADIGVPAGKTVIGLNVRGWEGGTGTFFVCKNSAGTSLVLVAPSGTFSYLGVEVIYN